MIYLLDTNTCVYYLNGSSDLLRSRVDSVPQRDLALCSVVKAELLYGAIKSGRSERNLDRLRFFFSSFASLPFDDAAAEAHGEVRARLARAGQPIGPNDLCIAAIALTNRLTLVTHNTREFSRVDGLVIEDWM